MSATATVSIQVSESEHMTIVAAARQAGPAPGMSTSGWIKARIAAALVDTRALGQAELDIAALAGRGMPNRQRNARVSTVLSAALHADIGLHAHAIGVTVHDLLQGVAVITAEREVDRAAARPVEIGARDIRPGVARVINSLWRVNVESRLVGDVMEGKVLAALRERMKRDDYGRDTQAYRKLDRLPAKYRDMVLQLAGWLGMTPARLYTACERRADNIKTRSKTTGA